MAEVTVRHDPAELRYEALVDGVVRGEIVYGIEPGLVVLIHTEVAPSAEGTGVGSRLVRGALDDARTRGLRVVPLCPFVAGYIRRHPEYADLVASDPASSG